MEEYSRSSNEDEEIETGPRISPDDKRSALLTVALEHNLINLLTGCVFHWSDGEIICLLNCLRSGGNPSKLFSSLTQFFFYFMLLSFAILCCKHFSLPSFYFRNAQAQSFLGLTSDLLTWFREASGYVFYFRRN